MSGAAHVERWFELTEQLRATRSAPTTSSGYFIFQTLVGAWPIEPERIEAYMEKALREAKRNTSWVDPNERLGGGASSASAARCTPPAVPRRLRAVRGAGRGGRRAGRARRSSC